LTIKTIPVFLYGIVCLVLVLAPLAVTRLANLVLGQADFTSSDYAVTRSGMNYPQGVADTDDHRVQRVLFLEH
jgi:hypothetical protein